MPRLFTIICVSGSLLLSPSFAQGQTADIELFKKEIDLLKREIDLLKRENELLKSENAALKKGGSAATSDSEADAALRVTVDNVEYVYSGSVRNGAILLVGVLATSKKGVQSGPNGAMTLIDDEGEKYTGKPMGGFGARPVLREGVPVRLVWQFGGTNAFTGAQLPAAPTAKVSRFAIVIIEPTVGGGDSTVEFRNVPAVVAKSKAK